MTRRLVAFATIAAALAACGAPEEVVTDDDNDEIIVPEGKEDNFVSVSASEFTVSGTATLTLEPEYEGKTAAQKLVRAKQLVSLESIGISWFLNAYLIKKENDAGNANYGGFGAIARFDSEVATAPKLVSGLTYKFDYKVQVGGKKSLVSDLPGTTVNGGGKKFTLAIGKVPNADLARLETNHEWYRDAPWNDFDPSKLRPDQKEDLALTIMPQKESLDAYLAHDRLFKDGEITIALHTGWDYHARYDVTSARNVYNWLTQNGFKSPAASFAAYDRTSGPLTKTVKSNGKNVAVKVWVFHPGDASQGVLGPDPDTDEGGRVLENDMRESFAKREVVIYLGHSGPLYGFALANWRKTEEGDLDDSDVKTMTMNANYQIVLANGCDTYAMGQAFWKNPAKKDQKNLNVITTTSFSNAGTEKSATRLISALTGQTNGKVVAVKVSDLARGLDQDQGWAFDTMFGVHGTDDNPRYDPFSDPTKLCVTCTADSGCGADGNRCTKINSSQKRCTLGCLADSGCPTNYVCRAVASASSATIKSFQCVPKTLKCP